MTALTRHPALCMKIEVARDETVKGSPPAPAGSSEAPAPQRDRVGRVPGGGSRRQDTGQVAARIVGLAEALLRAHVERAAEYLTRFSQ